jgi:membrane protease YdiL (CAAX protease family)
VGARRHLRGDARVRGVVPGAAAVRRLRARCRRRGADRQQCGAQPAALGAKRAWRAALAFTAAALIVLAIAAMLVARNTGTPALARFGNWHMLAAAALYLPWALLQQYIFQFYLFPRWLRLVPVPVAIGFTALAFSAVHFPRWPVMAVTVVAGTVWALIYYHWRRLLPLALSHALLGTALHYWVFGNDLLARWLGLIAQRSP